jgi:tripartite-type tricarboxylate transporter receptor subunit TctC
MRKNMSDSMKKRIIIKGVTGISFLIASGLIPLLANAQTYPAKPITLVVPNPPGGFVDASARILSDSLARVTSQSVIVDNKGGGSGNGRRKILCLWH